MKLHKYQNYLILSIAIAITVLAFFSIQNILGNKNYSTDVIVEFLFSLLVSINIVLVNFPLFDKIKSGFPFNRKIIPSILIGFLITSITAAAIITVWVFIFYFTINPFCQNEDIERYGIAYVVYNNIITAVVINTFVGAFVVIRHSTREWKKAAVEAEKFKRQSIESQYTTLVNQINPHFLFNSLNALASLIPQSPEKAVEFVNKFSKIYRYVLDARDKIVCEIKDELDFADSYCFLQKIRFGDNLIIEKQISSDCLNKFLPPLSIQLLIENAIKHNEISRANPLKIKIYNTNDFLFVENNLSPKDVKSESTGIGLNNLIERYKHLCNSEPTFNIENEIYIAKLPVITEE
ncbi:MAG: histidine kinase [Bacteroidales bacterium]